MHQPDALDFVFDGAVTRHDWDEADPEERLRLVDAHLAFGAGDESFDDSDIARLLPLAVVEQLVSNSPPEVWATAQRLAATGLARDEVLGQITTVLVHALRASLSDDVAAAAADVSAGAASGETDRSDAPDIATDASEAAASPADAPAGDAPADVRYRDWLATLPFPTSRSAAEALQEIAAPVRVLPTDELVARALERLGYERDNRPVRRHVERVEEHLAALTDEGPLAWVAGGRTVHVAALTDGITLTHHLSEDEWKAGALAVSFDLAGFARVDAPVVDGTPLEVRRGPADPGGVDWVGPDGWLDRFEPGTVLAVRVGDPPDTGQPDPGPADGGPRSDTAGGGASDPADPPPDRRRSIHLEALATVPEVDEALADALRRVYDDAVAEPGLPVTAEDLLLGLLAEEGTCFDVPQAPLDALCEAAGLERRGTAVAHDRLVWAQARTVVHARAVAERADDKPTSRAAVETLTVAAQIAEDLPVDLAHRRSVLNHLRDDAVLAIVSDRLFDLGAPPAESDRFAAELLAAAHGSPQVSTGRYLAALAAELAGEVDVAEQQLELAVEADSHNLAAVDRLAWYASDRGDAGRAVGLWQRCQAAGEVVVDLRIVEPFAQAPGVAQGRNDPCWCGSGRKLKHCHLGSAPQAPLPDRVPWLCQKAVDYLRRHQAGRHEVVSVALALGGGSDGVREALADPLPMDLVLVEGGWFHRFLCARGQLLPDDEAELMASWLTVPRSVYELTAVRPEAGLTVRDVRTGVEADVRERTLSTYVDVGERWCARVVPDGDTHQIVGGVFPVDVDDVDEALAVLDAGDPQEIALWRAAADRRPTPDTGADADADPDTDAEPVL